MKITKREIIHITIIIIVLLIIGFGGIKFNRGFQDNQREYLCTSLKMSVLTNSMDDIERMEENKQLCNNENCTTYFNERINNKFTIINDTLEGKHCEKYGFVENGENNGN